jgi:hypothetical protein
METHMRKKYALYAVAAMAVAVAPAAAIAAPAGPEGPANCSFANGITTCGQAGSPVVTVTTGAPDSRTGCVTTTTTTTTTTTYTAHHGTYNSHGTAAASPPASNSQSSSDSTSCPTHGSVALNSAHSSGCNDAGQNNTQIGTVYWYESGSDVLVHVEITSGAPSSGYYFAQKCVAILHSGTTSSSGSDTFDTTLPTAAGATMDFDYFDGSVYAETNTVTV